MNFYDLTYDGIVDTQWGVSIPPILPGEKEWWDVWAFSRCEWYKGHVPVQCEEYEGPRRRTDFTWCGFNSFVVSKPLGELMRSIAPDAIQLVPIVIDDEEHGEYFIVNILDEVDCIDLKRSKVEWGERNGKNEIVNVYYLEVDDEKANGHDIFRLGEFSVQVLVSERIAKAMRESGHDGFRLAPLPWSVFQYETGTGPYNESN